MRILLPFFLLVFSLIVSAQDNTITVMGDLMTGSSGDETIREVTGNVVITQGNITITCDTALHYISRNDARLIGNVVLTQNELTIRTPEGYYFGDERIAISDKGLVLSDGIVVLSARNGDYSFPDKRADFKKDVKLVDTASTLLCENLTYYREEEKAIAQNNVCIYDTATSLQADSLVHWRRTKVSFAFRNVLLTDFANNTILFGNRLEDDGMLKYTIIDDKPLMMQIDTSDSGEPDTLFLQAEIMEAMRDSTGIFIATDSVRILRGTFASKNEKTIYYQSLKRMESFRPIETAPVPVIWSDNSQLSGDSIRIYLKSRAMEKMEIRKNSLILTKHAGFENRYDQIAAATVDLLFDTAGVRRANLAGNVLSIYYMFEDSVASGLVKSSSRTAVMHFLDDKIDRIHLYGDPNSEYHPEKEITGKERTFLLPEFVDYSPRPVYTDFLNRMKFRIPCVTPGNTIRNPYE